MGRDDPRRTENRLNDADDDVDDDCNDDLKASVPGSAPLSDAKILSRFQRRLPVWQSVSHFPAR